jgi:hypothetical protein
MKVGRKMKLYKIISVNLCESVVKFIMIQIKEKVID